MVAGGGGKACRHPSIMSRVGVLANTGGSGDFAECVKPLERGVAEMLFLCVFVATGFPPSLSVRQQLPKVGSPVLQLRKPKPGEVQSPCRAQFKPKSDCKVKNQSVWHSLT